MLQFKSIKAQIAAATGISLVAAIFAMAGYGAWMGKSLHNNTSTAIVQYSENMVAESLKQVAGEVEEISRTINTNIVLAKSIGITQTYLVDNNKLDTIGRDEFSQYIRHVLAKNEEVLGAYVGWEANVIDYADEQFQGEGSHSDAKGQYGPYWTRSASGNLSVRPMNWEATYDQSNRNSRGLRRGEWYLCSFEGAVPCVTDPAVWDVQGKPTLMTSITAPLIVNGKTVGVSGVDVSMQFIQQLTERVNAGLYEGKGHLKVYSHHGAIVADTENAGQVGKFIEDSIWNEIKFDVQSGRQRFTQDDNEIKVLLPLVFTSTKMHWAVEMTLPLNVAMAEANQLNATISERFTDNMVGQLVAGVLFGLAGFAGVFYFSGMLASPVRKAARLVHELSMSNGDLTRRLRIDQKNEVGRLVSGLNSFLEKTHGVVTDTSASVAQLTDAAEQSMQLSVKTDESVNSQKAELTQVSSAIYQMSQASAEVSRNCTEAANSAQEMHAKVLDCSTGLDETVSSLQGLTQHMRDTAGNMDELETATQSISGILDVIKSISEQTNLLALNAAIEAARAGEQGRGFAVVADEVRNLASRTQESTEQINDLMQSLVKGASLSVQTMREGTSTCEENVERAMASQNQLKEIVTSTQDISGASITIASAVEQQNAVADEISRNVVNINDVINLIADYATQAKEQSVTVKDTANDIQTKLNQFKY